MSQLSALLWPNRTTGSSRTCSCRGLLACAVTCPKFSCFRLELGRANCTIFVKLKFNRKLLITKNPSFKRKAQTWRFARSRSPSLEVRSLVDCCPARVCALQTLPPYFKVTRPPIALRFDFLPTSLTLPNGGEDPHRCVTSSGNKEDGPVLGLGLGVCEF